MPMIKPIQERERRPGAGVQASSLSMVCQPRPGPTFFILVMRQEISLMPSTCSPRYSASRKSHRWASPSEALCRSSRLWLT